eukprot:gnl/Spiro4/11858_TR6259_c0_g1_i1.p1 gnl/Spiro4/11858_TR6259_c0_g1~~gnl/Spiro4/11858_TR6259_c0_g1_i1.p1  ORF type:complete len:317 (+),score=71.60 gnl/Spiro4/11858_TR6259_c0_g1_i1:68-952(+)
MLLPRMISSSTRVCAQTAENRHHMVSKITTLFSRSFCASESSSHRPSSADRYGHSSAREASQHQQQQQQHRTRPHPSAQQQTQPPQQPHTQQQQPPQADAAAAPPQQQQPPQPAKTVLDLQLELEEKNEMVVDLKDKFMRALAECENVRRRAREEVDRGKKFGLSDFAKSLVNIVDDIERATDYANEKDKVALDASPEFKTYVEGIAMCLTNMHKLLVANGISKVTPLGEKFDPNLHMAQFEVPDPTKPAGTVTHVLKSGYVINGRILRPAQVGIVKAPPQPPQQQPATPAEAA